MPSGAENEGDVWGLISDVHGNYAALVEALRVLQSAGVRKLAFLGDYLGRGESDRCVDCIRRVADLAIVGNRDLDWQDRVSAASRAWVLGLPRLASTGRLLISHGDARLTPRLSTGQIGRDFVRAWPALVEYDARVWAFGHSHHARVWRKTSAAELAQPLAGQIVRMQADGRYCVNVGSAGLPFPGKGGASVAVVDFARGEIRHIMLDRV
ncbi:MAG TPA: metallophosphoesterase family protein [Chloroflexota bacterium]